MKRHGSPSPITLIYLRGAAFNSPISRAPNSVCLPSTTAPVLLVVRGSLCVPVARSSTIPMRFHGVHFTLLSAGNSCSWDPGPSRDEKSDATPQSSIMVVHLMPISNAQSFSRMACENMTTLVWLHLVPVDATLSTSSDLLLLVHYDRVDLSWSVVPAARARIGLAAANAVDGQGKTPRQTVHGVLRIHDPVRIEPCPRVLSVIMGGPPIPGLSKDPLIRTASCRYYTDLAGTLRYAPSGGMQHATDVGLSRYIECNATFARIYHLAPHGGASDTARQFEHEARNLLVTAKRVLDALGIRFWISSGTLLGWFREVRCSGFKLPS